jgi:Ca2+-binding RTX toxin-like protein
LVIGAFGAVPNGPGSGASYLVFGKTGTAAVALEAVAQGSGGAVLNGVAAEDNAGLAVAGAGDVNGDGLTDLLLGARFADSNGSSSGASYLVFADLPGATTQAGDASANALTGSAAVDRLVGGRGNDILIGNGGADVLYGGQGDDTLAISDATFSQVDGGTGSDTLRLDGPGASSLI